MYSIEFQQQVLKLLCSNILFFNNFNSLLESSYFETQQLRIIHNLIHKYILTYNKEPHSNDLYLMIDEYCNAKGYSSDTLELFRKELKYIINIGVSSEQFIIDKVVKFVRRQKLKNAVIQAAELLATDTEDFEIVLKNIDLAVSVGCGVEKGKSFKDLLEFLPEYRKLYSKDNLLKTGLPTFDKAVLGGLAPGELHVITAPPGRGKSTLGVNIGAYALVQGAMVVHFSLELKELDILAKYACFTPDTKISLLNGTEVPIKDLVGLKEFYVYSRDSKTNKIVPGRAHSCRKTGENREIIKIILDNGEIIKCTPDHKFRLKSGKYKEAKDLLVTDSLSPLYRRVLSNPTDQGDHNELSFDKGYEQVLQPEGFQYTHRMSYHYKYGKSIKKMETAHHKDFDKRNNDPKNILVSSTCSYCEPQNHKIISIEPAGYSDVYDFEVDTHHNFALSAGVFVHNCRLSGLTYSDLMSVEDSYYKERMSKFSQLNPSLFVKYYSPNSINAHTFRSYISKLRSELNINPGLIIVDYDDLILPITNKGSMYEDSGSIHTDLIGLGDYFKCFTGDTKIKLLDGGDLCLDKFEIDKDYWVYGCKETGEIIRSKAVMKGIIEIVDELIEITLDNNEIIKCTPDHRFMLKDGSYKEAQYLTPDDSLMSFRFNINSHTLSSRLIRVKSPVYCLTTETGNFALSAGVFVHNCPVLTFSQPKCAAWNKEDNSPIEMGELSQSSKKAHSAYSMSSLNRSKSDRDHAYLFLDKVRRGEDQITIPLVLDLGRCYIGEDTSVREK